MGLLGHRFGVFQIPDASPPLLGNVLPTPRIIQLHQPLAGLGEFVLSGPTRSSPSSHSLVKSRSEALHFAPRRSHLQFSFASTLRPNPAINMKVFVGNAVARSPNRETPADPSGLGRDPSHCDEEGRSEE